VRRSVALLLAVAVLPLAIFLLACGDDDDGSGEPTAETTAAETPAGGTEPVEGTIGTRAGDEPPALMQSVEAATQTGGTTERVLFNFTGAPPDYRVEYVTEARDCTSGAPIDVAGRAFLQVSFSPASNRNELGRTVANPLPNILNLRFVVAAVPSCDTAGSMSWIIGLRTERPFQAVPVPETPALAIDIT
jgi:hypothetical protein